MRTRNSYRYRTRSRKMNPSGMSRPQKKRPTIQSQRTGESNSRRDLQACNNTIVILGRTGNSSLSYETIICEQYPNLLHCDFTGCWFSNNSSNSVKPVVLLPPKTHCCGKKLRLQGSSFLICDLLQKKPEQVLFVMVLSENTDFKLYSDTKIMTLSIIYLEK